MIKSIVQAFPLFIPTMELLFFWCLLRIKLNIAETIFNLMQEMRNKQAVRKEDQKKNFLPFRGTSSLFICLF